MSKFKEMKFWIGENGDSELTERVCESLSALGYSGAQRGPNCQIIMTDKSGRADSYSDFHDAAAKFSAMNEEEINIDWMRKPTRKTVKIGDKEYYEDELAEALSKIKAVE